MCCTLTITQVEGSKASKSAFKAPVVKAINKDAEKVPIKISLFQGIFDGLPAEKQEVITKAKDTLEKEAFIWGNFPISLPPSQLEESFAQVAKVFCWSRHGTDEVGIRRTC